MSEKFREGSWMSRGDEDELPSCMAPKDRPCPFASTSAGSGLMRPRTGSPNSSSVLRFFFGGVAASAGRFLHERCRVPGRLSGPLRFGTASYSHSLLRRVQLWHTGLVESQRILRARLLFLRQLASSTTTEVPLTTDDRL